jgi:hypothetical protein
MTWLVFLLLVSYVSSIQVCQNKNCRNRFKSKSATIPEVLCDLGFTNVEIVGCLSQCEDGPNVRFEKEDHLLHGLVDVEHVVHALEHKGLIIPMKLKAAVKVIQKARTGTLILIRSSATSFLFSTRLHSIESPTSFDRNFVGAICSQQELSREDPHR